MSKYSSDLVEHLRKQHLAKALNSDIMYPSQKTSRFMLLLFLWIVIAVVLGIVLALSFNSDYKIS